MQHNLKTFSLSAGIPLPSLTILAFIKLINIGIAALNGLNQEMDDIEAFNLYRSSHLSLRKRLIPTKGYYITKNVNNGTKIDIDLTKCNGALIGLDFLIEWYVIDGSSCPVTKWMQTTTVNRALLINWYLRTIGINKVIGLANIIKSS